MKKKLVLRLLAVALVFCLGSGEALAAAITVDEPAVLIEESTTSATTGEELEEIIETPAVEDEEETIETENSGVVLEDVLNGKFGNNVIVEAVGPEVLTESEVQTITVDQPTTEDQTTTENETEELNLEYSYNFIYTQPNNSVVLSPSTINAEKVVEMAYPIIVKNEGGYASVNPNDNGAVSIGRIQWHGNRAMQLMREIIETDPNKAYKLLGKELYEEVTNSSTNWGSRILTSDESRIVSAFLSQMDQSKAVQDKMAKADIAVYVNHGIALGIRNVPALVYFSDLENQGGYGRSKECAQTLINMKICKSYGAITLNELYLSAVYNSVMGKNIYLGRRTSCYQACVGLGYTYCTPGDSVIPYVMNSFSTSGYVGEAWLQWALNTYGGANLEITDKYDDATRAAVMAFQEANGMEADGQAGKSTLKALATLIIESGTYNPSGTVTQQNAIITTSKTKWEVNDTALSFALGATSNHSQSALTYNSSNTAVVTVSADGTVDTVGPGTATITVSQAATSGYLAAAKTVTIVVYDNDPSAYATPTTTLAYKKTGMKKTDIQWLQASLNKLNSADLLVDGVYGSGTDKATRAFQEKVGTVVDGEVGPNTRGIIVKMLAVADSRPEVTATGSTTGVTLKWTAISNATGYKIYRRDDSGSWRLLKSVNASTLSYVDKTGTAGKAYGYTVKAYYKKGSAVINSKYVTNVTGTKKGTTTATTTGTYPVPTRTLKVGCTGDDVKWLQTALNKVLGVNMLVDGGFGNTTLKYVKEFQTKYNLEVDGVFGPGSRTKLQSLYDSALGSTSGSSNSGSNNSSSSSSNSNSTTTTISYPVPTRVLKQGLTGDDVKWLQTALNKVLGVNMLVDGEFGNTTLKYVKEFQTKYNLEVDGIFGPGSRTKLQSLLQ